MFEFLLCFFLHRIKQVIVDLQSQIDQLQNDNLSAKDDESFSFDIFDIKNIFTKDTDELARYSMPRIFSLP